MPYGLDWGIATIVWLQSTCEGLRAPAEALSVLGSEPFFLIVMPLMLWCFDVATALRLGVMLTAGACVNSAVKLGFGWPRPYWVSAQVHAWGAETSFGLPSGHAQIAVAVWGLLAAQLRRPWVYGGLALLALLISLSRWQLGVHFPVDTFAGWAIGGALLAAFLVFERPASAWLRRLATGWQLVAVTAASLALLGIGLAVQASVSDRPVPVEWVQRAAWAAPAAKPIDPTSPAFVVAPAGALLGLGCGAALLLSWGGFEPRRRPERRALRVLVGLVGLIALSIGLGLLVPADHPLATPLRYLSYAATAFWGAYLAPRVFVKLHLA